MMMQTGAPDDAQADKSKEGHLKKGHGFTAPIERKPEDNPLDDFNSYQIP